MNHADDEEVENKHPIKAITCIFLVGIQTFMYMPLLDVFVKVIEHTSRTQHTISAGEIGSRYAVAAAGIILLYFVTFYSLRFFNLNVPTKLLPWCAPLSKLPFTNLVVKASLILSCTLDRNGKFVVYEVAFIFVIQTV